MTSNSQVCNDVSVTRSHTSLATSLTSNPLFDFGSDVFVYLPSQCGNISRDCGDQAELRETQRDPLSMIHDF